MNNISQKEVFSLYFESLYLSEDNDWFLALLETFGEETNDSQLKALILDIHQFAFGFPNPKKALNQMIEPYHPKNSNSINQMIWIPIIQSALQHMVSNIKQLLQKAIYTAQQTIGFEQQIEVLQNEIQMCTDFEDSLSNIDYENWRRFHGYITFNRLPSYKGDEKDISSKIQSLRKSAKDMCKKIHEEYFSYDIPMQLELIQNLYPIVCGLVRLTIGYMDEFSALKKERLLIDFQDYEHFCLQILVDEKSTIDHIIPTPIASEVQLRYAEIMVDEYQDINLVQEMILYAISTESQGHFNRFMVGDVKQSIYGFRLAMPELFNQKFNQYDSIDTNAFSLNKKILLSQNFRSRKNVLDGINFIFKQCMSTEFGDIAYTNDVALHAGKSFPETDCKRCHENEVILIDTNSIEFSSDLSDDEKNELETLQDYKARELELLTITKKIQSLFDEQTHILDPKTNEYRLIQYQDIAVLFRGMNGLASTIEEAFLSAGIPYYADTSLGYFQTVEVDTILNLLHIIDNPLQDIPLIASLRSPLYRLTTDELMQIRLYTKDGLFFHAVEAYRHTNTETTKKLNHFFQDLEDFREQKIRLSLYELLSYIYDKTNYFDYVGMSAGGSIKQGNLNLLLEKAFSYEQNIKKGLFYFIRYIEDMKETKAEPATAKFDQHFGNFVNVMTIHKSKGLEFPVVFIADTGKKFNLQDLKKPVLTHQNWGLAMNFTDLQKRGIYSTLCKTALKEVLKKESYSEELRILYVAMTRAKEKLIIIGSYKNLESAMEKWKLDAKIKSHQFSPAQLLYSHHSLDWIMMSLLRHPRANQLHQSFKNLSCSLFQQEASDWFITIYNKNDLLQPLAEHNLEQESKKEYLNNWDTSQVYSEQMQQIQDIFSWKYPHELATQIQGKVSITENILRM